MLGRTSFSNIVDKSIRRVLESESASETKAVRKTSRTRKTYEFSWHRGCSVELRRNSIADADTWYTSIFFDIKSGKNSPRILQEKIKKMSAVSAAD